MNGSARALSAGLALSSALFAFACEEVDGPKAALHCITFTPLALPISNTSAGRFAKIPTVTMPAI